MAYTDVHGSGVISGFMERTIARSVTRQEVNPTMDWKKELYRIQTGGREITLRSLDTDTNHWREKAFT